MSIKPQVQAPPAGEEVREKVQKILETIEVRNIEQISRVDTAIALGRLLSVKAEYRPGARPSVHEVTKEVRKAVEMVVRNLLKEDEEGIIKTALYTTPPFKSAVLNEIYRLLLERLLRETAKLVKQLGPMWRKRLVNLMVENIYNAALIDRDYRDKIFTLLGAEELRGESE